MLRYQFHSYKYKTIMPYAVVTIKRRVMKKTDTVYKSNQISEARGNKHGAIHFILNNLVFAIGPSKDKNRLIIGDKEIDMERVTYESRILLALKALFNVWNTAFTTRHFCGLIPTCVDGKVFNIRNVTQFLLKTKSCQTKRDSLCVTYNPKAKPLDNIFEFQVYDKHVFKYTTERIALFSDDDTNSTHVLNECSDKINS